MSQTSHARIPGSLGTCTYVNPWAQICPCQTHNCDRLQYRADVVDSTPNGGICDTLSVV